MCESELPGDLASDFCGRLLWESFGGRFVRETFAGLVTTSCYIPLYL